jgi:hypothetical protein
MMVLYVLVEDNYPEHLLYTKLHEIKLKKIHYNTIKKKQLNRSSYVKDIYINFSAGFSKHPVYMV